LRDPALASAPLASRLKDRALLSEFLLAAPMLLFALVAHEVAHGWTALRQGDDTAAKLGRITLNPIPHIDPVFTIAMPALLWFLTSGAFTFGGARPVPVVTRNFRNYVRGDLIVSSAGVITNFGLAVICTVLFIALGAIHDLTGGSGTSTVTTAQRMLNWGIYLNLILAVFNLIPIPPLDGSRLLYHALPPAWGLRYRAMDRFGFLPLMALILLFRPLLGALMAPAGWLYLTLIRLAAPFAVGFEWNIFS
jgi:Zn-dependent protease